jgi:hypothetical protein
MKIIRRGRKIVMREFTPDDEPPKNALEPEQDSSDQVISTHDDEEIINEESSGYSSIDDYSEYPQRGHIPGNKFVHDGKIVTNPGLRDTGWVPTDDM